MKNLRNQLRKVATIIACLVVTTMFVACDSNNPNDDDGGSNGNIDKKLVGFWERTVEHSPFRYWFTFKDDGSFQYIMLHGTVGTTVDGKYTTSNGRVYFTDLIDDRNEKLKNQNFGYSLGTDSNGEFLSIATILIIFDSSIDEPVEGNRETFRRRK